MIVETSGVALPFDTQLNLWREPVSSWIEDDAAVVVVNAEQVAEGRDLEGTFVDQITSADLLVVNKVDLVSEAQLEKIRETLVRIEDEAPIVICSEGRIDPGVLFPPERVVPDRSGPAPAPQPHTHEHFETEEWQPPRGITPEALEQEIAGRRRAHRRPTTRRRSEAAAAYGDLTPGDHVVHRHHGIGRFEGMVTQTLVHGSWPR